MDFFDFSSPGDMARNIREMVRCPFCGSEYTEKNIKVLGRFGKNHVLQLVCKNCANSIMANVAYKNGPEMLFDPKGQLPDIEFQEIMKFFHKGPINDNDVMDFFQAMREFDGDFNRMFTNQSSRSKRTRNKL